MFITGARHQTMETLLYNNKYCWGDKNNHQPFVMSDTIMCDNYYYIISANVGGQMGLFLGASILSVTELIEFLLFVIWYMCVYLTKRNVMVSTGNNMTKHVQVVKR